MNEWVVRGEQVNFFLFGEVREFFIGKKVVSDMYYVGMNVFAASYKKSQ